MMISRNLNSEKRKQVESEFSSIFQKPSTLGKRTNVPRDARAGLQSKKPKLSSSPEQKTRPDFRPGLPEERKTPKATLQSKKPGLSERANLKKAKIQSEAAIFLKQIKDDRVHHKPEPPPKERITRVAGLQSKKHAILKKTKIQDDHTLKPQTILKKAKKNIEDDQIHKPKVKSFPTLSKDSESKKKKKKIEDTNSETKIEEEDLMNKPLSEIVIPGPIPDFDLLDFPTNFHDLFDNNIHVNQ